MLRHEERLRQAPDCCWRAAPCSRLRRHRAPLAACACHTAPAGVSRHGMGLGAASVASSREGRWRLLPADKSSASLQSCWTSYVNHDGGTAAPPHAYPRTPAATRSVPATESNMLSWYLSEGQCVTRAPQPPSRAPLSASLRSDSQKSSGTGVQTTTQAQLSEYGWVVPSLKCSAGPHVQDRGEHRPVACQRRRSDTRWKRNRARRVAQRSGSGRQQGTVRQTARSFKKMPT